MRPYEVMVVLRADLSEDERMAQLNQIQSWIDANGGETVEVAHWGTRRLAYPIRHMRDGYYVLYTVNLPPKAPLELERNLRLSENVLRYLITRQD